MNLQLTGSAGRIAQPAAVAGRDRRAQRAKPDAMFYVAGKPVSLFAKLGSLTDKPEFAPLLANVHFVPLDDPRMLREYQLAEIGQGRLSWTSGSVPTIAVKAVLMLRFFRQVKALFRPALPTVGSWVRSSAPISASSSKTGHPMERGRSQAKGGWSSGNWIVVLAVKKAEGRERGPSRSRREDAESVRGPLIFDPGGLKPDPPGLAAGFRKLRAWRKSMRSVRWFVGMGWPERSGVGPGCAAGRPQGVFRFFRWVVRLQLAARYAESFRTGNTGFRSGLKGGDGGYQPAQRGGPGLTGCGTWPILLGDMSGRGGLTVFQGGPAMLRATRRGDVVPTKRSARPRPDSRRRGDYRSCWTSPTSRPRRPVEQPCRAVGMAG